MIKFGEYSRLFHQKMKKMLRTIVGTINGYILGSRVRVLHISLSFEYLHIKIVSKPNLINRSDSLVAFDPETYHTIQYYVVLILICIFVNRTHRTTWCYKITWYCTWKGSDVLRLRKYSVSFSTGRSFSITCHKNLCVAERSLIVDRTSRGDKKLNGMSSDGNYSTCIRSEAKWTLEELSKKTFFAKYWVITYPLLISSALNIYTVHKSNRRSTHIYK